MRRITLWNLLALIGLLAVGLAAMRTATDLVARAAFTLTLGALLVGLLGLIIFGGRSGGWAGFTVFGWAYAVLAFHPALGAEFQPRLLTSTVLEALVERVLGSQVAVPTLPFEDAPNHGGSWKVVHGNWVQLSPAEKTLWNERQRTLALYGDRSDHSRRVGHALLTLVFALLGALLGRYLAAQRATSGATPRQPGAADPASTPEPF